MVGDELFDDGPVLLHLCGDGVVLLLPVAVHERDVFQRHAGVGETGLGERDALRVVNDQHGCPTYADDLAAGLIAIAARPTPGTYHLTGTGATTWYDFARAILARALKTPRLEPIATAEYPTPARRPANAVLDCSKAKRTFAVELPPWNDGLSRMLDAHLGRGVSE